MITSTNGSMELMIAEPLLPLLLNSSSSFYQPSSGDSVKEFQCRHSDPIEHLPSTNSVSNIPSSTIDHPSFPVREREGERNEKTNEDNFSVK